MDHAKFFAGLRSSLFRGGLSQPQVDGINAILDSCRRNRVADPHHVANILAQVYHETGGYMFPIKETVYASHKDKNPSDATVISRLNNAWAKGQLSWVKTPYWRDGWFGRGMIQLTHRENYLKMGRRLGVPLVENPALALDPAISADIAVVGMSEGMFTGRRLSQYQFPGALTAAPGNNPRRIVNGQDGTDAKVAGHHRAFHKALIDAGWGVAVPSPTPPADKPAGDRPTTPEAPTDRTTAGIALALLAALAAAAVFILGD